MGYRSVKAKFIGVFEAREAWLWVGLSGSLSSSFYIVNLLVFLRRVGLGCGLVSRGPFRSLRI